MESSNPDSSSSDVFHGLIRRNFFEQVSQDMYSFFSYIYTVGKDFDWVNLIVRYWRIWCAIVPVLCANYPIYDQNSFSFNVVDVLSIPAHWIPVNEREEYGPFLIIAYSLFLILFDLSVMCFAVNLSKNGVLGTHIPNLCIFLCESLILIMNYPAVCMLGETLGRLFSGKEEVSALIIISVILGIYSYGRFLVILRNYISICVSFRPFSMVTVSYTTQLAAVSLPALATFLLAIASELPKIPRIIITFLVLFVYAAFAYTPFLQGGYVQQKDAISVQATSLTAIITLIMFAIQDIIDMKVSPVQFFIILLVYGVSIIIVKHTTNIIQTNYLIMLDILLDEIEAVNDISSANKYMNIVVCGFKVGHPVCINWSLCQAACNRWPENKMVWYIFLKFIAIYPDQSFHLNTIYKYFNDQKSSSETRQILTEIKAMLKVRESNLSAPLKSKLSSITAEVNSTKHKLRNVCDILIQGNVSEMEKAVANTYESVQSTTVQYNHLIRQYPNNRFVTRSYSRYLHEICSNIKESIKYDNATKLIQRGIQANPDKAHILGIKSFPALPESVSKLTNPLNMVLMASEDGTTDIGTEDPQMDDKMINLEDEIESIKFPKLNGLKNVRIVFLFLLWIIPLVTMTIYGSIISSKMSKPLEYVENVGRLAIYNYMIPMLAMELVLEKSNLSIPINITGGGGYNTTKEMLLYYIKGSSEYVKKIGSLQSYQQRNPLFTAARKLIYSDQRNFTLIADDPALSIKRKQVTVIAQLTESTLFATTIVKRSDSITEYRNKFLKTIVANSFGIIEGLDCAIQYIIDFTEIYKRELENQLFVVSVSLFFVSTLIWVVGLFIAFKRASKEKDVIYRSLTILPKNVISGIIDKLKLINKNNGESGNNSEEDTNKQEDNIIKIFATAGDADSNNGTFTAINTSSLIVGIFFFFLIIILFDFVAFKKTINLSNSAPHIRYTIFSYVHYLGTSIPLLSLFANKGSTVFDYKTAAIALKKLNHNGYERFSKIRYGNETENVKPFNLLIKKFTDITIKGGTPEVMYMLKSSVVNRLYTNLINNKSIEITKDMIYKNVCNDLLLFNQFFDPIETHAVNDVLEEASKYIPPTLVIIGIIILYLIIQEFYVYSKNALVQKRLKFTLKLLLHCPMHVIQQSNRIMNILAGNFDTHRLETATRGTDYFLEIINNLPDSFIVTTKRDGIVLINNSARRLFGEIPKSVTQVSEIIHGIENAKFNDLRTEATYSTSYITPNGNEAKLEILISAREEETIYTIRDNTQTLRYNQLIAEERQRSDLLLASILPPKLVPRVQSGEKDISFEVQTASVIFMDIVEFTPWCASHQAGFIMTTLNRLFTEFDDLVARSSTLTRIKCIGDCYMAAGGIFSELNQPDIHARESVKFGIDSINVVRNVGKEINENLRIRVGINSGGPLVAGVIGTGKPTFEIIGPVINMAQQMEHHGVPMHVHISRSVYEYIYGNSNFVIKERGQIEIKNGTAMTYLVTEGTF